MVTTVEDSRGEKQSTVWVHPRHVQEVISAPLEENLVDLFLSNLNDFIEPSSIPHRRHIQILLHLVAHPPASPLHPPPLHLLQRLLSCHSPPVLSRYIPAPNPTRASQPTWLDWQPSNKLEHNTLRLVKRCKEVDAGIWDMIWEGSGHTVKAEPESSAPAHRGTSRSNRRHGRGSRESPAKKVKRTEQDEGFEEEEQVEAPDECEEDRTADQRRVVSGGGWDLLSWLLDLWEKDQAEYHREHPLHRAFSPMFVAQLPRPSADLPSDNAGAIIDIAHSAFESMSSVSTSTSTSTVGPPQRLDISIRLVQLLINAALHHPAQFHRPSLILTFLTLFRSALSRHALSTFVPALQPKLVDNGSPYLLPHIIAIAIEDFAGVRVQRAEARKRRRTAQTQSGSRRDSVAGSSAGVAGGAQVEEEFMREKKYGSFPPPTLKYLLSDLLLLKPSKGKEGRMVTLKLALLSIMMGQFPLSSSRGEIDCHQGLSEPRDGVSEERGVERESPESRELWNEATSDLGVDWVDRVGGSFMLNKLDEGSGSGSDPDEKKAVIGNAKALVAVLEMIKRQRPPS